MRLKHGGAVLGLTLALSCGASQKAVRPDEMSAEAHRQEAQKESEAARAEVRQADAPHTRRNPVFVGRATAQGDMFFEMEDYDPRNDHLLRAEELRKHAEQHGAAAKYLETFEAAECKEFPPATRAACPLLGPLVEIADVPGGVRARFAEGVRVDAVVAHMQCHLAFAQSRGFDTVAGCPLYVRGIEIRRASGPGAVEIVGRNATVAREIRRRAREEAVLVRASTKP
jgi:hypothetical protein